MTIELRHLQQIDDLQAVVDLEIAVWRLPPRDAVPGNIMRAIAIHGGSVIGAYDGDRMVGMALAFPMRPERRYIIWSHMAGVHPDYQGCGIGFQIKQAQRDWALAHGYDEMRWTYEPLLRGNANFNLHRLGATASIYHRDYYGQMTDEINILSTSDRLEVVWKLASDRVARLAAGDPTSEATVTPAADILTADAENRPAVQPDAIITGDHLFAQIPRRLHDLERDHANAWRFALRETLENAFAAGYVAVDFIERSADSCGYVLQAPTPYFMYVLRCADGSLYTGITNKLEHRLKQHNSGSGAAYTASRRPVTLLGAWRYRDRSAALKAEAAFKKLKRPAKLAALKDGAPYRDSTEFRHHLL